MTDIEKSMLIVALVLLLIIVGTWTISKCIDWIDSKIDPYV